MVCMSESMMASKRKQAKKEEEKDEKKRKYNRDSIVSKVVCENDKKRASGKVERQACKTPSL